MSRLIRFCLENRLVVALLLAAFTIGGVVVAPFDWKIESIERYPVPVDAIPDLGENQQIVFTEWMGRSPQDVEDQITYPLTVALLGIPRVKTIRSLSMFGFSSIFVIFHEDAEFYWSRSRVLEKLASLPSGTVPEGVRPTLGPDATGLGQIFWYTLEGRDESGATAGGFGLEELRRIQDFYIRPALLAAEGVADVASIGGFVQEYQIDVDPDAMRAHDVTLEQVFRAVSMSNLDVGARTIEVNRVEYVIRSRGFVRSIEDLETIVVKVTDNVPIMVKHLGQVHMGPALRRGALDKGGTEAVGGVVIARFGANPLATLDNVKRQIESVSPWGEARELSDGRKVRVHVVPFYDRTELIHETLDTLDEALTQEILVTILVVIFMVMHLRSSLVISGLLPLAVLMSFLAMKAFSVDANIVALSGIAIAIGTMVDMGIVVCENILRHLEDADPQEPRVEVVHRAATEVAGAVLTAILTTVTSFLPVFLMDGAEGRLFKPLAFTKTFALLSSVVVAIVLIPPVAHMFFSWRPSRRLPALLGYGLAAIAGLVVAITLSPLAGGGLAVFAVCMIAAPFIPAWVRRMGARAASLAAIVAVAILLARRWSPLGPGHSDASNLIVVACALGGLLILFWFFERAYENVLGLLLRFKTLFLVVPLALIVLGLVIWLGFHRVFGFLPALVEQAGGDRSALESSSPWTAMRHEFPGLGEEFMPALDEGAYLLMPTMMVHASIGEALDVLSTQDRAIRAIPEVAEVVGKIGRAETALDPAPISMVETLITYKPEFVTDEDGRRIRQWRDHIRNPDDIWEEIVRASEITGTTSAPRLQPIETRLVMLQTGMRAPMGIKIRGPSLEAIEEFGMAIEERLKQLPDYIRPETVFADRVVGKPYLEIEIDREAIARYGIHVRTLQDTIEVAVGGRRLTSTVEGRERYGVRVRYMRELRDEIESLDRIQIAGAGGVQVPLAQLASIRYVRGPQVIKSEDTFLTSYVLFDRQPGRAEVDVVEAARDYLDGLIASGELVVPEGVERPRFSGTYENQVRAEKKLMLILPIALFVIFVILYLQFKSSLTTFIVFSGIAVAWAGGFILIWLYGQDWFLDLTVFDSNLRDIFQVHPISMSVAVWVGFLALFGIATDDGVVIATYLEQTFDEAKPATIEEVRAAVVRAGKRRIRPCLMTTATTLLALLPVLTARGRGADVMIPMAIPSFGGMSIELLTMFVVPVLYCLVAETRLRARLLTKAQSTPATPS